MPKIYALDRQDSIVIAAADYFEDLTSFRRAVFQSNEDLFTLNTTTGQSYIIPQASLIGGREIDVEELLFDDEFQSLDGEHLFRIDFLDETQKNTFIKKHNIELLNCLKLSSRQRDMKSYNEETNRKNSFVQDNRTIAEILGLNINDPWDRRDEMKKLSDQENDKRMRELMSKGMISSDSSFTMPSNGKLVKEVEIVDGRVVSATAHVGERTISKELRESLIRDNERKLRAAGLQSEIIDENWNRGRLNKLLKFFNEELKLFNHKPINPIDAKDKEQAQKNYIEEHNPTPAYYQDLQNMVINIRSLKSNEPNISVLAIDFNTVDLYNVSGQFIQNNPLPIQLMCSEILSCINKNFAKDLKFARAVIIKNTLMLCMHEQIVYENDLDIHNTNTEDLTQTIKTNKVVGEEIEKFIEKLHKDSWVTDKSTDLKIINKIEAIKNLLEAKGVRHIELAEVSQDHYEEPQDYYEEESEDY